MISARTVHTARARLATARSDEDGTTDGGFALILVMIVMLMVTSALAIAFGTIIPNYSAAGTDQSDKAALEGAYAGIQDFVAFASSTNGCRTTACARILGYNNDGTRHTATSTSTKVTIGNTNAESFTWWTEPSTTSAYYVRVHATGYQGSAKRTLTADVGLTNPFLAFGYYSDYETQSAGYVDTTYGAHTITIPDSTTAGYVKQSGYNSSQKPVTVTASAGSSVAWAAPGSNSISDAVCNQHWYAETLANGTRIPGRASFANLSTWGQNGTLGGNTVPSYTSCDVNFTTGITFDGPVYSRDALLVSDGTTGGAGPNFTQPVSTLWGAAAYTSPAPSNTTQPWRQNAQVGGAINTAGSYKPSNVGVADLQLPLTVGTADLPDNACIYTGPTRVKLTNGTATVTSPLTTTKNPASDPNCYPTSVAGGIVNFALNYATIGNNTVVVKNLGTAPKAGWPTTGQTSQLTPSNSYPAPPADPTKNYAAALYLTSPSGTSTPDKADTSAAPSASCSSSVKYSAATGASCAWSDVSLNGTANIDSAPGWSKYTTSGSKQANAAAPSSSDAARCAAFGTAQASDRELFECEYSGTTGNNLPPQDRYAVLRTAIQNALTSGSTPACTPAASSATQLSCLTGLVNAKLAPANSGSAVTGYTPASGDHRYVVTAATAAASSTGTAQTLGSAPAAPMASDPLFSNVSTPAKEAATTTPATLTVSRQTYDCYSTASPYAKYTGASSCTSGKALSWGDGSNGSAPGTSTSGIAQFTATVTQTDWQITQQAQGTSSFPTASDVTQYSAPVSATNAPGDLYVEGTNQGVLSLIADNDAVVTGDLTDTSKNQNNDAVDLVAGNNVRNYHPVSCTDQVAADITATSPGWCPNDIGGLYSTQLTNPVGTFKPQHPAAQYVNMTAFSSTNPADSCPLSNNTTSTAPANCREIDAAVFALGGSFLTDNVNRGNPLGSVAINGGLYQSHRGANGVQWEYNSGDPKRASSGANLQYHYINLQRRGLPFTPASTTGSSTRPWQVVSISEGGGGTGS